jgi:hypothetical protein
MKRLATVALGLFIAIPVCAQRAAGHSGFAARGAVVSHAAPAFRRSFAPPASMRYRSVPVTRASRPYAPAPPMPRFGAPSSRYMTVAPPARRPGFYQPQGNHAYSGDHHPRIRTYPVYPGSVVGFFPPDLLDSDLFADSDYDNSAYAQPLAAQPGYPDNGYPDNGYSDNGYPDNGYPGNGYPDNQNGYPQPAPENYYPPYPQPQPEQEQAPAITPEVQYVPGSADTVTLIFKDGRPPEQIQNYIATKKTLTVINGSRHRDIPIADLDVPATIKANRETGVGFQLPVSTP